MTTPLLAFHGKKTVRSKYINRVRKHRLADEGGQVSANAKKNALK